MDAKEFAKQLAEKALQDMSDSFKASFYALGQQMQGGSYWDAWSQRLRELKRERKIRRNDELFGTGEVGGDSDWEPPVHAVTANGVELTVSFGRKGGKYEGHVLYKDGHTSTMDEFYGRIGGRKSPKKHEHDDDKGGGSDRGQAPRVRGE